jgi:plastocyanin
MKRYLLISALFLFTSLAFSGTVVITNSGFEFSPDDVEINLGDTVVFQLGNTHNAVEVSLATWNANGNTPLPGFSVAFGGGTVTGLSAGTHYYVCAPHASGGMKGKITVNSPSGIQPALALEKAYKLYPNPTSGLLVLENTFPGSGKMELTESSAYLEFINMQGRSVYSTDKVDVSAIRQVDISRIPAGQYIVRISDGKQTLTGRVVKIQ